MLAHMLLVSVWPTCNSACMLSGRAQTHIYRAEDVVWEQTLEHADSYQIVLVISTPGSQPDGRYQQQQVVALAAAVMASKLYAVKLGWRCAGIKKPMTRATTKGHSKGKHRCCMCCILSLTHRGYVQSHIALHWDGLSCSH